MAEKPQVPTNLFINLTDNYTVICWDKVVKDIENTYTTITAYYVYKSNNIANRNWKILRKITSKDVFNEVDTFCIDWEANNGNYIYKVCPENAVGIGACAVSLGIIGSVEPIDLSFNVDNYLIWNQGKWDQKLWK